MTYQLIPLRLTSGCESCLRHPRMSTHLLYHLMFADCRSHRYRNSFRPRPANVYIFWYRRCKLISVLVVQHIASVHNFISSLTTVQSRRSICTTPELGNAVTGFTRLVFSPSSEERSLQVIIACTPEYLSVMYELSFMASGPTFKWSWEYIVFS